MIADNCYLIGGSRDDFVVACGDHKVKIYIEHLSGKPHKLIIYKDADKKWLEPHENESISVEQHQFILDALVKHFEKLGNVVEVQ